MCNSYMACTEPLMIGQTSSSFFRTRPAMPLRSAPHLYCRCVPQDPYKDFLPRYLFENPLLGAKRKAPSFSLE